MSATSLDDLMALNDQLVALADAGMPLELGLGHTAAETAQSLGRINASVARRVAGGASLDEALTTVAPPLHPSYLRVVRKGLLGGQLDRVMNDTSRSAEATSQLRGGLRTALIYPLIVVGLALVGLALFSVYLTPVFTGLHAEFGLPDSPGVKFLSAIRASLPYWGLLLPVLVLVALWRWRLLRQGRSGEQGWKWWSGLPAVAQAVASEQRAAFAERLAALLRGGVPLPDALRQLAVQTEDRQLAGAAKDISVAILDGRTFNSTAPVITVLPPMLRWALVQGDDSAGRAEALETTAAVYRSWSAQWSERSRVGLPLVACVLLGGGATLLYGLTLFLPVTELLSGLSQQ